LHGDKCIGNDGKGIDAPKIGDNVSIGFESGVFGKNFMQII